VTPADVSIAIPTYRREEVLVTTLDRLVQARQGEEILVLDQTERHGPAVDAALARWDAGGAIRWIRLPRPSIPAAMNEALRLSRRSLVLFLDDDIVPGTHLVAAHAACYDDFAVWAVSGQVLQPGQDPAPHSDRTRRGGFAADLDFPFNSIERAVVANCMAGNLSVRRERALAVGGFDENFVGAAYRFETEFCRRLLGAGGVVLFEPAASLRHLRAPSGGIRSQGDHRGSASPAHSVGDYYFAFRHAGRLEALTCVLRRPLREICTRYHLARPWLIPVKLLGELRAVRLAISLARQGPRFATRSGD
jgi:GT2 family glycosyltransferase